MPTGGFFGLAPTARGTGNAGAASIFLTPFTAPQNGTATAVLLDVPGAVGSISLKALVYDGSHSALLATGSTVSAVVANYNRLPLTGSLSVVAGTTYYVGYVCSASLSVTVQSSGGATSWLVSGGQSVPSPANPLVGGGTSAPALMTALELDGTGSSGFGYGIDQSNTALSLSNTVATITGANAGARSILTHLTGDGKLYAEVAVSGTLATGTGIGISSVAWGTNQGSTSNRAYLYLLLPTGSLLSGTSLGLSYVTGDVIGIAYDATNNFIWWNKNNGSWFGASSTAGNPATPTGGLAVQTTWPMAISIATTSGGATGAFTLRDTAGAQQYSRPSGYSAWSSAAGPVVATSQARALIIA